ELVAVAEDFVASRDAAATSAAATGAETDDASPAAAEEAPTAPGVGVAAIAQVIEQVALASHTDQSADAERGQSTLMRLHTAKGLEFPAVSLTGLEHGEFPHSRSFDNPLELSEERRLAYVGPTRARQRLLLSRAETRSMWGQPQY